jgi:predicted membrane metal-binding protein
MFFCLCGAWLCFCGVGLFLFCYWFISVCPCAGQALTFFAAAKKDKQRKRLTPPAYKRVPRTVAVVVHLESVFSHIRRL